MNEPPAALLQLTRLLGGEPARPFSRGRCWALIFMAGVAVFTGHFPLETAPRTGEAFLSAAIIVLGLMLAALGAGLLRESREGLSLWFSVLYALLSVPLVLLVGAHIYAWAAFVVTVFIWDRARR